MGSEDILLEILMHAHSLCEGQLKVFLIFFKAVQGQRNLMRKVHNCAATFWAF